MDETIFLWFNRWNGHSDGLDAVLVLLQTNMLKAIPFMLAFWALWFWPKTPEQRLPMRESLVAALVTAVPIMGITRMIANYAPHSPRPIHTPDLAINLHNGQSVDILDGWSSMPSDHASLFFGFAIAVLTIHRRVGLFLLLWAIFITSLPRIVMGLHWPSDILAGWAVGTILALLLMKPVTWLVRKMGVVPFFDEREAIGYPLLFLATFEFGRMFQSTRQIIEGLL